LRATSTPIERWEEVDPGRASSTTGPRIFNGRGFSQFAAASELVLRDRWPPEQVQVETKARLFENVSAPHLALDIVVWDRAPESADARAVIAVEVKLEDREAEEVVRQVASCGSFGGAHEHATKLDGHKKYLGLVTHRSPYYTCLTPTRRWVYWVSYSGSEIRLHVAEGIPFGDAVGS
jgi:hypothetical protein